MENYQIRFIFLLLTILLAPVRLFAQGCSDAGICSLSILKNNTHDTSSTIKRNSVDVGINYGIGEQETNIFNLYLQYQINITKVFALQTKVNANYANGFLGNAFNIGDIYLSGNYFPVLKSINKLNLIGGVKVPLSFSNDKNTDGKPLPLDYQASLGTIDGILGVNYIINNKLEFDLATQIPVIQLNKNSFFTDEYLDPRINKFSNTNNFRRKADLFSRIGYYIALKKVNTVIKPSLSAIYHLGNDSYEDRFTNSQPIPGSKGITLNGSVVITKTLKSLNRLELFLGTPFIVRDARPDGLTRSAVINLQYTFLF